MKSSLNLTTLVVLLLSFAFFSSCNQAETSNEILEDTANAKKVNLDKDSEPYHVSPNATANKKLVVEYLALLEDPTLQSLCLYVIYRISTWRY